ncbi:MAG: hypothetical protein FJY85_20505, partial [Deltaproteobacteria bacterium]|nr:hypothetical protein [Deltaproteobacteria bacterium]
MKAPALESVFLNRSPIPEQRDFSRVLVLGGDKTGMEVAERLSRDGYDVVPLNVRG